MAVPNKYNRKFKGGVLDPYTIAELYGITDHRQFHVLKKMLRAGNSEKTLVQEIDDCISTLARWKEMLEENQEHCLPPSTQIDTPWRTYLDANNGLRRYRT